MVAAIRQRVTVKPGGVIEIRSPELRDGESAEVIVLTDSTVAAPKIAAPLKRESGDWRRFEGIFNGGDKHSANNERIDADLARSYLDPHEPRS